MRIDRSERRIDAAIAVVGAPAGRILEGLARTAGGGAGGDLTMAFSVGAWSVAFTITADPSDLAFADGAILGVDEAGLAEARSIASSLPKAPAIVLADASLDPSLVAGLGPAGGPRSVDLAAPSAALDAVQAIAREILKTDPASLERRSAKEDAVSFVRSGFHHHERAGAFGLRPGRPPEGGQEVRILVDLWEPLATADDPTRGVDWFSFGGTVRDVFSSRRVDARVVAASESYPDAFAGEWIAVLELQEGWVFPWVLTTLAPRLDR